MAFPLVTQRQIGAEHVQSVDGRDLHAFLGVSRDFNQWSREQISRGRLKEGRDYLSYEDVGKQTGGRPRKECAFSLDASKHVALMSQTEKGFEVREYFIDFERRAKATIPAALLDFSNPVALRAMLLQSVDTTIELQGQVAALAPKADALDLLVATDEMILITDGAKRMGMQAKDLFTYMRTDRWLYRRGGSKRDIGYDDKIRAGLLVHKYNPVPQPDGTTVYKEQVHLTPKGLAKLAQLLGRKITP